MEEIHEFVVSVHAKLREAAAAMDDPEDANTALRIAVLAWQLVRGLCDENGLAVVAKDGVICGLAKLTEGEDREPAEL